MNILIGLILFFIGGFFGVCTMCIIQVGANSDKRMIYVESKENTEKK